MKTVTKKQIKKELRTLNPTNIFRIAKLAGVDVAKRSEVCRFIRENAPNQKIQRNAYNLSYGASFFKHARQSSGKNTASKISTAIRYAMQQKKEGKSNYSKILVVGNSNIYWASPAYLHSDYNKSIAFENTEKTRKIALKINKYLNF